MAPYPTAPAKINWGSTVMALMHQWRESGGREETERICRHKGSPESEATPAEPNWANPQAGLGQWFPDLNHQELSIENWGVGLLQMKLALTVTWPPMVQVLLVPRPSLQSHLRFHHPVSSLKAHSWLHHLTSSSPTVLKWVDQVSCPLSYTFEGLIQQ